MLDLQIRPALPQDAPAIAQVLCSVEWLTRLIETPPDELHRWMLVNSRERPSYQREFYKKNGWQERESMANFVFELS